MAGCRALKQNEFKIVAEKFKLLRDKLLFVLGTKSGFRITELLSLKVESVYKDGILVSRLKVSRKNMKGKITSREVVLHKDTQILIKEYISSLTDVSDAMPLFKSKVGENKSISRKHAWSILKKACEEAGLTGQLATHTMRKTFAHNVYLQSRNDLVLTQKALGHTTIMNTVKYLEVDQDAIDAAILGDSADD
jgi:site-specific recombinase XerD